MVFGSPYQRSRPEGVSPAVAQAWAVDAFRQVGDAAAARGVTLCLEALPADLTNVLTTNAEVAAFVAALAHPHVGMMVDVKSMSSERMPIVDNLRTWAADLPMFTPTMPMDGARASARSTSDRSS